MASIQARRNKDGHITSYTVKVFTGRDADGKQRFHTESFKPEPTWSEKTAEKRARDYAANLERDIKDGRTAAGSGRQTLAEYWTYVLQTRTAAGELRPQTVTRWNTCSEYVFPRIGAVRLKDLTPALVTRTMLDIQTNGRARQLSVLRSGLEFPRGTAAQIAQSVDASRSTLYAALRGEPVRRETAVQIAAALSKPFSAVFVELPPETLTGASVRVISSTLSAVCAHAVKEGLIARNPCAVATLPRVDTEEAVPLTPEEVAAILAAAEEHAPLWLRVLLNLAAFSGLRRGELLGVAFEDIDAADRLHVRRSVVYTGGKSIVGETKTKGSRRTVKLPSHVVALIDTYSDTIGRRSGLLFQQADGQPIRTTTLTSALRVFIRRSGLPPFHLHQLRHSAASIMISAGIDPTTVSRTLGHSATTVTLNTYSHLLQRTADASADTLTAAYQQKP